MTPGDDAVAEKSGLVGEPDALPAGRPDVRNRLFNDHIHASIFLFMLLSLNHRSS